MTLFGGMMERGNGMAEHTEYSKIRKTRNILIQLSSEVLLWYPYYSRFMVTSPPGRLATSKLATNSHPFCCVFFSHVQTTNLKVKLSRPNGIACLRKRKLRRRRAYKYWNQ